MRTLCIGRAFRQNTADPFCSLIAEQSLNSLFFSGRHSTDSNTRRNIQVKYRHYAIVNGHHNTNSRLTFNFDEIEGSSYGNVTERVVARFKLEPVGELIADFDEVFQNYQSGNLLISLEWGICLGHLVIAADKESMTLATGVATFISEQYSLRL